MTSAPDLAALDPHARRFLAMVALGGEREGPVPIEARRASFTRLMRFCAAPDAAVRVHATGARGWAGPIPLRLYAPQDAPVKTGGLIYFHGGGLVAGDLDTHDPLCRTLAHGAGCRIVSVGYRLAPEHPFPAALLDAFAATRWIVRHVDALGIRPDAVGIGGDSGGATLAAVVAARLGRHLRLRLQLLLCPVLDAVGDFPSRRAFASGFLLDATTMATDLVHYAPTRDLADPALSPVRSRDLARLPPTLLHTAGFDPLQDEAAAYAARLEDAGVPVLHRRHPTLIHHFYGLTGVIPAAREAVGAVAQDLAAALG